MGLENFFKKVYFNMKKRSGDFNIYDKNQIFRVIDGSSIEQLDKLYNILNDEIKSVYDPNLRGVVDSIKNIVKQEMEEKMYITTKDEDYIKSYTAIYDENEQADIKNKFQQSIEQADVDTMLQLDDLFRNITEKVIGSEISGQEYRNIKYFSMMKKSLPEKEQILQYKKSSKKEMRKYVASIALALGAGAAVTHGIDEMVYSNKHAETIIESNDKNPGDKEKENEFLNEIEVKDLSETSKEEYSVNPDIDEGNFKIEEQEKDNDEQR